MPLPALPLQHADPLDLHHRERLLDTVIDIVVRQRYGAEYQPIICARSGEITAYEALARFYTTDGDALPPLTVFEVLHDDPALLKRAECDLKVLQLDHAPAGHGLFLNLDPHALSAADDQPALLDRLAATDDVVVELIENTDIHDARAALALHSLLAEHGVRTALDDIGAPHALLSLDLMLAVDFLKFDRSWFNRLTQPGAAQMLNGILDFATQAGHQTIIEGVETTAMAQQARGHGVHRLQGFLYRPLFRRVTP